MFAHINASIWVHSHKSEWSGLDVHVQVHVLMCVGIWSLFDQGDLVMAAEMG